ncbi:hypothetical protein BGX23_011195 [Mortierella sp. AD031]|nr:hypothetical protein BGX23_011195 [Mortierella sp. AD031]
MEAEQNYPVKLPLLPHSRPGGAPVDKHASTLLAQNATKSNSDSVDQIGNLSDDSDFQTASTSGPSTLKATAGKMAGNKRRSVEKNGTLTPKKQRQEDEDPQEQNEGSMEVDRDENEHLRDENEHLRDENEHLRDESEHLQDDDHDAEAEHEDPSLESVEDPEYNPDYYSSDDDQEWIEVPVPGIEPQSEAAEEYEEVGERSGPWQYNAVEIVFDRPLEEIKKKPGRGITKEERMIRVLIHQTHLLCLIANGLCRNRWINSPKMHTVALSLVPEHIASSVQKVQDNPVREVNALQVLALWWRDSFVVTGPGIETVPYADIDVVGVEAAMPANRGESIKKRKNLQRRLLNRSGSSDVCSQLFTAICRALGLRARLVESLQACSFKVTFPKEETAKTGAEASFSGTSTNKKGKKKKDVVLDESDTTRGSRVVISTPHRLVKKPKVLPNNKLADPPVFWAEVYGEVNEKWITIDPVRGVVDNSLKMHPANSCTTNHLAYVVAYDQDNFVTDVTRRYTSQWTSVTKKLRVQPAGPGGFDWWAQTMACLANPSPSVEEDLEEAELVQAEVSERMPTRLGDFNNHPIYALERHLKKFEVLHPRLPVLGHIRGEAIYPRSCVKQVRSKENWLKRARQIKADELIPVKWIKSRPATIFQMRLQQQATLAGNNSSDKNERGSKMDADDDQDVDGQGESSGENGDQVALFGEWQTKPYQPPWVVDGKVPRNQYGRQDVFTPAMVPIGGAHLKGRNIARIARQLGVDYVEAVTGFEFQSRRSVPVIQGIIVPTECAELVMDAYREVAHHADREAAKRKRAEVYGRWRKLIKGVVLRSRLMEQYGQGLDQDDDKDSWVPEDDDDEDEDNGQSQAAPPSAAASAGDNGAELASSSNQEPEDRSEPSQAHVDSGGGFMFD